MSRILLTLVVIPFFSAPSFAQWGQEPLRGDIDHQIETHKSRIKAGLALKAGNKAYAKKDFTQAIREYDDGIWAFPGNPDVGAFYINKALAYRDRGNNLFTQSERLTEPAKSEKLQLAKNDWIIAARESLQAVVAIRERRPDPNNLIVALAIRAQTMCVLVTKVDKSELVSAITAFDEYQAKETNLAEWLKAQKMRAKMYFQINDMASAAVEFERVLISSANDLDSIFYLGFTLSNSADRPTQQRAADYIKRYLKEAPATAAFRSDAIKVLNFLKQNGIMPFN